MKKLALIVALALALPAFAADSVTVEAQKQIAKEQHEARVSKATSLLARQARLLKELKQVDADLIALDDCESGAAPCKEEEASFSSATGITTNATILTTGGNYLVAR